jgi:hypothetical protein
VQPTPGTTLDVLSAVSCTASTACIAVGHTGFSDPLAEEWNGSGWATQATVSPPGASLSTLTGVSCVSSATCIAVGSILDPIGDGTNLTLAEQWTGTRWDVLASFNPTGTTRNSLSGVSCANAGVCTAVGYFFDSGGTQLALAEQWTETTGWQLESTPRPTGSTGSLLSGVSCTTSRNCTAVGVYGDATGTV